MKRVLGLIVLVFFSLSFIGCSTDETSKTYSPSLDLAKEEEKYTKSDAILAFQQDNDLKDYEIIDCVLKDDDEIPELKAFILYFDKDKNNSCNLAFICDGYIQRICFALNEVEGIKTFEIADGNRLTYIGEGTVTTSIRRIETNEILNYTIYFSYNNSTKETTINVTSTDQH